MIDRDGIERPDDPHAHMQENKIAPADKEIDENYKFLNRNIFFRLLSRLFRRIAILLLGPWIKYRYKLHFIDKKNIRYVRHKGVVVTVNHVHNFDTPLILTRLLKHRKCYFLTLKDNVNMPFVGFLLRAAGAIPIPTKYTALPAFEDSVNQVLSKKKALIISPEASLWPYYRDIRPFKKGAFRFAVKNNCPILPVVIIFRDKPHHINKKRKYNITVQIGKPIFANNNLKENDQIVDLRDRTFNYYKETTGDYYSIAEEKKARKANKKRRKKSNKNNRKNLTTQSFVSSEKTENIDSPSKDYQTESKK